MRSKLLVTCILLSVYVAIQAQDIHHYNDQLKHINRTGMMILGSWAVTNIAIGTIAGMATSGKTKYFYQMNAFWNVVNLGIAAGALLNTPNMFSDQTQIAETINQHYTLEKAFLTNGALDVAYIMGGLYMREMGKQKLKYKERLMGYGNSIILQGGFLLSFDAVMYFIMRDHRLKNLEPLLQNINISPDHISYIIRF